MSSKASIFEAIIKERQLQDAKYGSGGHELPGWLLVIEKELAEAKDAATGQGRRKKETGRNSTRAELLQIAAVAVAALEQHGLDPVEQDICPKCGWGVVEHGYGLAGGGIGAYKYCSNDDCEYFDKVQDPEGV